MIQAAPNVGGGEAGFASHIHEGDRRSGGRIGNCLGLKNCGTIPSPDGRGEGVKQRCAKRDSRGTQESPAAGSHRHRLGTLGKIFGTIPVPSFIGDDFVRGYARQAIHLAAWPGNFQRVNFAALSEPKVNSRIACGHITHTAFCLLDFDEAFGRSTSATRRRRRDWSVCRSAKLPANDWRFRRRCAEVQDNLRER